MHEIKELKRFLSFSTGSTEEVFAEFRTINGHIFREKSEGKKERFLYVEGARENKALLVAHADTVYDFFYKKQDFFHSVVEEDGFFKAVDENGSPQLLGADDRAGLAMLWLLKDSGHSLLVTDGEEGARIGAKWLMKENRDIADRINQHHQFVIQLDRCNSKDFKCYHVGSNEFRKFIAEQTGYSEPEYGALTDVCSLCRDICGVNFSIGYYDNHSRDEKLNIGEWLHTLDMVRKLMAMEHLPKFRLRKKILHFF